MIFIKRDSYKLVIGLILLVLFIGLYGYIEYSDLSRYLLDTQSLQTIINSIGFLGPLVIVFFIAGAVVMSPIPSAPIAIASGYIYGHSWGTVYVLIGAELGAIIAFFIARLLGYDAIQKKFGKQLNIGWLNSSKYLMLTVCVSRLIPFISFDIVSYAAGLTKLSYLQFAIATLVGIIPASFLLAHIGSEMLDSNINEMIFTILLLGLITLSSVVVSFIFNIKRRS